MLTRPLTASISAISAIALTLGVAVLPGVTLGSLPIASAARVCPDPVAPTPNLNGEFELSTPAELQWVKDNPTLWGESFILTDNINMGGCEWATPIGDTEGRPFVGVLDGAEHSIANLWVNVDGTLDEIPDAAGLIGFLGPQGIVRNLTVTGTVSLRSSGKSGTYDPTTAIGGIVGHAVSASISSARFTGTVEVISDTEEEHPYAGGLVGVADASSVERSSADSAVSCRNLASSRSGCGGLVGLMTNGSSISKSYAHGSVQVRVKFTASAGGLVGTVSSGLISESFANVSVRSQDLSSYVGGLVGEGSPTITSSFALGDISWSSGSADAGGLIGFMRSDQGITDSYSATMITGSGRVGGLIGLAEGFTPSNLDDLYWDTDMTRQGAAVGSCDSACNTPVLGASGKSSDAMTQAITYDGWDVAEAWDPNAAWNICPVVNGGRAFLTTFFTSSPSCDGPAPALAPASQSINGSIGTLLASVALMPSAFSGTVRYAFPPIPNWLSGDASTGVISGQPLSGSVDTTYVIYGFGSDITNPMASAEVTISVESGQTAYAVVGAIEGCDVWGFVDTTPDGSVVAGCYSDGFVGIIPPGMTNGAIQQKTTTPIGAYFVTVDPSNGTIYTANSDTSSVVAVRQPYPATVTDSVDVVDNVSALGVGGGQVYAATTSGHVASFPTSIDSGVSASRVSIGGDWPYGTIAVTDDTIYLTQPWGPRLVTLDPHTLTILQDDASYSEPAYPVTLDSGETLYLGTTEGVSKLSGDSLVEEVASPTLPPTWYRSLAVQGGRIYTYGADGTVLSVLDEASLEIIATVEVGAWAESIAATDEGVIYIPSWPSGAYPAEGVQAIAEVSSSLPTTDGSPGDTITVRIEPTPSDVVVSEQTVDEVRFGGDPIAFTWTSSNEISFTVPEGTGPTPVDLGLKGGNSIRSGIFTYDSPGPDPNPGPAPVLTPSTPPSAPQSVTATAGDTTATVTWQAPASPGSSAITAYQVTSAPGGGTCLASAPALTCEVTGLSNGTSYTFTVRALNAAGWSEASAPSNAVTPTTPVDQAIVITGSRTNEGKGRRILIEGSTTGMSGMWVTPHFRFPGRSDYRAGVLSVPIDDSGTFRWSRNTSRRIFVYFDGGGVRSNTIVIAAR